MVGALLGYNYEKREALAPRVPYRRFVDSKILPLDMTERERVSTDPQFL